MNFLLAADLLKFVFVCLQERKQEEKKERQVKKREEERLKRIELEREEKEVSKFAIYIHYPFMVTKQQLGLKSPCCIVLTKTK